MIKIYTERLLLFALDLTAIRLLNKDRALLEEYLQLTPSAMLVDPLYQNEIAGAMQYLAGKMEEMPEAFPWFSPWEIVLRETNTTVGGIGFVGPPDENGLLAFGYHIDGNQHSKGFATEAIAALTNWAFSYEQVKTIQATTLPDNQPSQKVLLKNGFQHTGEDVDEGRTVLVFRKNKN